MSPAGRPFSDNPRNIDTRIRMNKEESEMLEYCARVTGKNKADIIRLGVKKVYEEIKERR